MIERENKVEEIEDEKEEEEEDGIERSRQKKTSRSLR